MRSELTTARYGASGRTSYLATGITGTRVWSNPGLSTTISVTFTSLAGVNAPQATSYQNGDFFDFLLTYAGLFTNVGKQPLLPHVPAVRWLRFAHRHHGLHQRRVLEQRTSNIIRIWVEPQSWSMNEMVRHASAGSGPGTQTVWWWRPCRRAPLP